MTTKERIESIACVILHAAKIYQPFKVTYFDLDQIMIDIEEQEYSIRMWNMKNICDSLSIDWTLFLTDGDHSEKVLDGYTYV